MKEIKEFFDRYGLELSGTVICAVSGGADSVCLLHAMLRGEYSNGLSITAAHFNHMLRGEEADRDEEFVRALCTRMGVPFYSERCDVAGYAQKHRMSTEMAARELRYRWLYRLAEELNANYIATAHNADDNAETLLLNLVRGTGLSGASGIPPVRGKLIRPLLYVPRCDIEEYLRSHGESFVTDSTNNTDLYVRNYIRHNIMPRLKKINPSFTNTAAEFTILAREDNELLEEMAAQFLNGRLGEHEVRIKASELISQKLPIASRMARQILMHLSVDVSYRHVQDILKLAYDGSASSQLILGGGSVRREYGELVFSNEIGKMPPKFEEFSILPGQSVELEDLNLKICCEQIENAEKVHNTFTTFYFKKEMVCGNISVRPRKSGDFWSPPGFAGKKSLKKELINRKVPRWQRDTIPVLADDNGVLAVYGLGADKRALAQKGDNVIKISIKNISGGKCDA